MTERVVRRRNRKITSCTHCRSKKLSCSKGHPCQRCSVSGDPCVYVDDPKDLSAAPKRIVKPRKRLIKVCWICRDRKVPCDKGFPCSSCRDAGYVCVYKPYDKPDQHGKPKEEKKRLLAVHQPDPESVFHPPFQHDNDHRPAMSHFSVRHDHEDFADGRPDERFNDPDSRERMHHQPSPHSAPFPNAFQELHAYAGLSKGGPYFMDDRQHWEDEEYGTIQEAREHPRDYTFFSSSLSRSSRTYTIPSYPGHPTGEIFKPGHTRHLSLPTVHNQVTVTHAYTPRHLLESSGNRYGFTPVNRAKPRSSSFPESQAMSSGMKGTVNPADLQLPGMTVRETQMYGRGIGRWDIKEE